MKTVETIEQLRREIRAARSMGKTIGFVPTMGNLHEGHMSLVDQASEECGFVVTSIFVNPLQFNDQSDLGNYPRTLAADQEHLKDRDCDLLFFPNVDEMYPRGQDQQTTVHVPGVSQGLCGGSRPGHFDGVSTVVNKLFNMVLPDAAFFGGKDYQQLAVIRKMVLDLDMPIKVVGVPTCRDTDGLAMSSRNGYLTPSERQQAVHLSQVLTSMIQAVEQGDRDYKTLCENAKETLKAQGFEPDYVEVCHALTLKPATEADKNLVILGAAFLGKARLIDNMTLTLS